MAGAFTAGLASSMLTVLIPITIGKFFNLLFGFESHKSGVLSFMPRFFQESMTWISVIFLALVLAKILASYLEKYWSGVLGEYLAWKVRNELFAHQLKMQMKEYDEKGIGKYMLRYSGDLKGLQNYLTRGLIQFSGDALLLVFSFFILLFFDYKLFSIIILFLTGTLFVITRLNERLYSLSEKQRGSKSSLISFVNTRFRSMLTIKAFNQQQSQLDLYEAKTRAVLKSGLRYQTLFAFVQSAAPSILYLMLAVIMVYIYLMNRHGGAEFDGGTLLSALLILITIMPVMRRILKVTVVWKLGNLSFRKLITVFEKPMEDDGGKPDFNYIEGKIAIENLDFEFNADNPVFSGLTCHFPPREVTWIQGDIGTGKTALLKLIMGIYKPEKGQISIDGQNISGLNLESLRNHITVVSSDLPLIGNTVKEAIMHPNLSENQKGLKRALDSIQGHIPEHMRLLFTDRIGDLGSMMSRGQRKMLAYVRAFTTQRSIIIVDEPFSDLDMRSAEVIARSLRKLKHKSTIIIFSRNPPSKHDDLAHILFVDNFFQLKTRGNKVLEETVLVSKNVEIGQSLQLINASVKNSKGSQIFRGLNLEIPGGKLSIIVVKNHKKRTFLRRVLTNKSHLDEGTFLLGSKSMTEADDQFSREMISLASPGFTHSGDTALDAVYGGSDKVMREEARRVLAMMQVHLPENEQLLPDEDLVVEDLDDQHRLLLSSARGIISKKPVLIMISPFEMIDRTASMVLARLIRMMKGNRTVLILSSKNPIEDTDLKTILDPDYFADFEDLPQERIVLDEGIDSELLKDEQGLN
ncbi:MAG: ATP-binding cassette domain-containing protein [Bacteroidia bacterium]|nr:ATP-binding cassette domain-containing protein [Bacteroidia bacterium]